MGYYQSHVKFDSKETLATEMKKFFELDRDNLEYEVDMEIVCVVKAMEDISPFKKGEWVMVVGGEWRGQHNLSALYNSTGIKAKDIIYVECPEYLDMANKQGLGLTEFLNKQFPNAPVEEVNRMLDNVVLDTDSDKQQLEGDSPF